MSSGFQATPPNIGACPEQWSDLGKPAITPEMIESGARALHKLGETRSPNWAGMTDWTEYLEDCKVCLTAALQGTAGGQSDG